MTEDHTHTLVLSGDAGIKSAKDVAGALLEAIQAHSSIAVDTQTVSAADITTVQTLLSARASAQVGQKRLTLLAPLGAPLQSVLAGAGLLVSDQEHAGFWSAISDQPAGH